MPHESPNDWSLRMIGNQEISAKYSLVPSLPLKMKILLILKDSWKIEIEFCPQYAISYEN